MQLSALVNENKIVPYYKYSKFDPSSRCLQLSQSITADYTDLNLQAVSALKRSTFNKYLSQRTNHNCEDYIRKYI